MRKVTGGVTDTTAHSSHNKESGVASSVEMGIQLRREMVQIELQQCQT